MAKFFDVFVITGVCAMLVQPFSAYAAEILLEADIDARVEHNDNIFLTSGPHDAVTGTTITPTLSGVIKEENWEANLNAMLRVNKYSDHSIDGNDQFFDLTGKYSTQRDIFSININHDLDSNLSSASTDFGIVGRRVERKSQSITPTYTWLLSERMVLNLAYTYSDIDFDDIENTAFTPFITESGNITLRYDLTESDQLTFSLQAVDYKSKDGFQTYQLFTSNIGIAHKLSETLSTDFLIGVTRRNSTNLNTAPFNFFGQIITRTQEVDFNTRGLALDARITKTLESSILSARISRNDTTNSFGGLDQVDAFSVTYDEDLSSLWKSSVNARFNDIKSVSNNETADRNIFFFEAVVNYLITPKWSVNASYRYSARKFKSDTTENRAPHSNRIYVGLNYNFPSLSTF